MQKLPIVIGPNQAIPNDYKWASQPGPDGGNGVLVRDDGKKAGVIVTKDAPNVVISSLRAQLDAEAGERPAKPKKYPDEPVGAPATRQTQQKA